ncbi:MAG: DUF4868 domain-containing protein [Actinomycetota bacterium]|nr:DUF4868 domain-containing protein [Actinomycetota bacterium]
MAYLPADSVPGLPSALDQAEEPADLQLFEPTSSVAETLRFYIVAIRNRNGGRIHFVRSKGTTLRLKRTRKIAAVMRGAVYDQLEADPLVFDATFDAIVSADVALVINQGAFERSLGFVAQAQELARETLTQLTERLEIANADDFLAAGSSDLNMVAKVRGIAEKLATDGAYANAMTTERLVAFATDNHIEIDVEVVDGNQRLVFHSDPARRWRILKLLDDDYLHSQLTELDYEVNSKSPRA